MTLCPECGGGLVVRPGLRPLTIGTCSLSGPHDRFTAITRYRLECRVCPWFVTGHLEDTTTGPGSMYTGGYFVADAKE